MYLFFIIQCQNWWQDQFQYLTDQKQSIIPSARHTSVAMFYLLWAYVGFETFFTNSFPSSNFACSATVKPRPQTRLNWQENISISSHSTSFYCHRANNCTGSFTNISIVLKGVSPKLYFIPTIIPCSLIV